MKILEIEGKTIDDAIEKACREFNVTRDKLNIEILSEGMSGFLGLGSKKAAIRAGIISFDMSLDMPLECVPAETVTGPSSAERPVSSMTARTDRRAETETDLALRAKNILSGILSRMDINCEVAAEETPDAVLINIKGDGNGLLIGKRGQNLDALQYIVNKAANKTGNGRKVIIVDAEDYRKRQEESLIALAEKIGEKVKKTKKSVALSYMNAHSRRVIHMALQNNEFVTTKSRGEGEYKKIVVVPVRKTNTHQ